MEFKTGSKVYTFIGEDLICATVIEIIDDLRISIEDGDCGYCVYKKHCYAQERDAVIGIYKMAMNYFLENFK